MPEVRVEISNRDTAQIQICNQWNFPAEKSRADEIQGMDTINHFRIFLSPRYIFQNLKIKMRKMINLPLI
jgi:hypothetical protein